MIFTIGYEGPLTPARLLEIAEALDARVFDVRSVPRSRKPGFSKTKLAALLGERYETMGHALGGRAPGVTKDGLIQVREAAECGNVILMCMEEAPGDCHRHRTICGPHFPDAVHIFEDELFTARELTQALAAGEDGEYSLCGSLAELLENS
jgi:uncharacterized protein (DUF488 family)